MTLKYLYNSPNAPRIKLQVAAGASVAIAMLILLIPAFANGFPFVTWDTGTYLDAALVLRVPYDRPVYYSIFAAFLHWKISPWPIVVGQSALVAVLIRLVAKSVFGIYSHLMIITIGLMLVCGSSLSWFVGRITPDIFTSVLVLSILLVTLGWHGLQTAERWFALFLIPVCIGFHNGNVLIAMAVIPALGAMAIVGWRPGPQAFQRFFLMAIAAALGVVALISANFIARGKFVVSSGSSTFLFGKLLDDGPALEVLESECPAAGYAVCSQLDRIRAYKSIAAKLPGANALSDYFLWNGPLESLGGFPGFEPEATILVGKALRRVSWKQAELSLRHAANQFARVAIGDDLGPYANDVRPSTVIRWIFGENVYSSYLASRQERGTLDFHLLNLLHPVVLAVSAFALLLASALWWRTDRLAVCITIFTALFLMGNATVTGTLSAVHDRYQSRIVWLVPLFAVLILMRRWLKLRSFECITIRGSEQ